MSSLLSLQDLTIADTETNTLSDSFGFQNNTGSPRTNAVRSGAATTPSISRGEIIVLEICNSGYIYEEQIHQFDNALADTSLEDPDRLFIIQAMLAIVRAQAELLDQQSTQIRQDLTQVRARRSSMQIQLGRSRGGTIQTFRTDSEIEAMFADDAPDSLPQSIANAAPCIVYADTYDKLVGNQYRERCLDCHLYHPRQPARLEFRPFFDRNSQFPTLGNQILVQARQARALAGLDTAQMDSEITYRILRYPWEWGKIGELLARHSRQDLVEKECREYLRRRMEERDAPIIWGNDEGACPLPVVEEAERSPERVRISRRASF